jgi:hypothetical protein
MDRAGDSGLHLPGHRLPPFWFPCGAGLDPITCRKERSAATSQFLFLFGVFLPRMTT